jgi:hypothetical protein
MGVVLLSPEGVTRPEGRGLAPRPLSLNGLRFALCDNSKPNTAVFLEALEGRLVSRVPGASARQWRKETSNFPAPFLTEMASTADAVVNGIGD